MATSVKKGRTGEVVRKKSLKAIHSFIQFTFFSPFTQYKQFGASEIQKMGNFFLTFDPPSVYLNHKKDKQNSY
jgi:hypothetical protein